MSVKIFVEGGGTYQETKAALRIGFGKLFEKIVPPGKLPRVVPCGGRDQAFKGFRSAVAESRPGECFLLIVDSEDPVHPGVGVWAHLKQRDNWDCPAGADETSAHLMVQCMESWFLADPQILVTFYGDGFQATALPGRPNIEEIPRADVEEALKRATRHTQKEEYHEIKHASKILGELDPQLLRGKSPHFDRLCEAILRFAS